MHNNKGDKRSCEGHKKHLWTSQAELKLWHSESCGWNNNSKKTVGIGWIMNHRQEIQSTALEIVNITKWIITVTEQITCIPTTQQIESMTEWILNITKNNRHATKNCTGMTENHTYMARNDGLHRLNDRK